MLSLESPQVFLCSTERGAASGPPLSAPTSDGVSSCQRQGPHGPRTCPPPPSGSHPVPTHQETTVLGCPRAAVLLHGRAGLICSLLDLKRVFFWLKSEHWRWNMVETLSQSGRKIVSVCWTLGPGRLLQSLMYQGEHLGAGSRHVLLADSRLSRVCLICIRNDFIWYIQLFYLK